mgnify:CR=1 FL=1
MESTFPGIQVHLACKDDAIYLLKNEDRIITQSELKENKNHYAYIRELKCNMQSHPVEDFMKESDIKCGPIRTNQNRGGRCVLLTGGVIPVRPLTGEQIKNAISHIQRSGQQPEINGSVENADWIVGTECEQIYQAAADGKQITLIPTGFGENIFKSMFPDIQILRL